MKLLPNLSDLETRAADQYGISSLSLMESAGRQVAEKISRLPHLTLESRIVLVCGKGNNGGDGFVCARYLSLFGFQNIITLQVVSTEGLKGDARVNAEQLSACPVTRHLVTDLATAQQVLSQADVLVDALFGSGLSRPVEGTERLLIEAMNAQAAFTVAIDLPSGIHAATGQVLGCAVQAELTLTFTVSKPGLHLYPGKACAGEVRVLDIGIPMALLESEPSAMGLLTAEAVRPWLPPRSPEGHKYTFGSVLVIAGSRNMPGAAVMAAEAALRAGAGIVTLAAPESVLGQVALIPEVVRLPLPETPEGSLCQASLIPNLQEKIKAATTLVVGPGVGQDEEVFAFLQALLAEVQALEKTVVLDADGLNALSVLMSRQAVKLPLASNIILTPHVGEFSRLIGDSKAFILADLLTSARNGKAHLGGTLVLKSASTVVVGDDACWINGTGNSGMATAGSGDVLAGLIAGLAAQGASAETAALTGVFLHGLAGDIACAEQTAYAMIATDITRALPQAFRQLLSGVCE